MGAGVIIKLIAEVGIEIASDLLDKHAKNEEISPEELRAYRDRVRRRFDDLVPVRPEA